MRKNKIMRFASLILVLTLLSTSVISGTFAKYTTTDSANDTARVAKWGVTALVAGSLYGGNYVPNDATEAKDQISVSEMDSVDTSNTEDIVAPGTKNSTGLQLQISGTPEVENQVTVSRTATEFEEIFLKAGTYATLVKTTNVTADNMAEYGQLFTVSGSTYTPATTFDSAKEYYEVHDVVTLANDYYPVVYQLETATTKTYTDLNEMYGAIETYFNSTNTPNYPIDKRAIVTWEWAIEQNNGADTILGNLMAKAPDQHVVAYDGTKGTASALEDGTHYNLTTDFDIKITVTQVD